MPTIKDRVRVIINTVPRLAADVFGNDWPAHSHAEHTLLDADDHLQYMLCSAGVDRPFTGDVYFEEDVRLVAESSMTFDDHWRAVHAAGGGDWSLLGINLSDAPSEWQDFYAAFGEVSLLAAITSAYATGIGGTLDDAYDYGGAGAGKSITADSGAVSIFKGANNSILALTNLTAGYTTAMVNVANAATGAHDGAQVFYLNGAAGSVDDFGHRFAWTAEGLSLCAGDYNTDALAYVNAYADDSGCDGMRGTARLYSENHAQTVDGSIWVSCTENYSRGGFDVNYTFVGNAEDITLNATENLILYGGLYAKLDGGAGDIRFVDGNRTGSTWSQAYMLLSDDTGDWDDWDATFGEVSLMAGVVAAAATGGGVSEPVGQVVYGTGGSVTSETAFVYDPTNNYLSVYDTGVTDYIRVSHDGSYARITTSGESLALGAETANRISGAAGNLIVRALEVNNIAYFDQTVVDTDNVSHYFGDAGDAVIKWGATSQTYDSLLLGVSGSYNLIFINKAYENVDYGVANSDDPTFYFFSGDDPTSDATKYGSIGHTGSNFKIYSDTGSVYMTDNGTGSAVLYVNKSVASQLNNLIGIYNDADNSLGARTFYLDGSAGSLDTLGHRFAVADDALSLQAGDVSASDPLSWVNLYAYDTGCDGMAAVSQLIAKNDAETLSAYVRSYSTEYHTYVKIYADDLVDIDSDDDLNLTATDTMDISAADLTLAASSNINIGQSTPYIDFNAVPFREVGPVSYGVVDTDATGGTFAFDADDGAMQTCEIDGDTTWTLSSPASGGSHTSVTFYNTDTSAHTVTIGSWTGTIQWMGDTADGFEVPANDGTSDGVLECVVKYDSNTGWRIGVVACTAEVFS